MCKMCIKWRIYAIRPVALDIPEFFSNLQHFLGCFLVQIAWNLKVNFTYSAISEDLLLRIARNSLDNMVIKEN